MSSLPPPPPPPPPPQPQPQPQPQPNGPAWSTPISAITEPAPPVTEKQSGFPAWGWIVAIVAVLGGSAVALIVLGGEDKKSNTTVVELGRDTTIATPSSDNPGTSDSPTTSVGGGSTPVGATGTRDAPVPVGQIADLGGDWRLQVLDVIPDAGEVMAANDEFYDAPPAGTTYMMVKLALGYFGTEDPKIGYEPDLAVLGSANIALDNFCLATVPDEVDFFNYLFSGGVVIGNACFIAPIDQAGTFQLFGKGDFFADEGVYLELGTPASPVQPMSNLAGPQPGAASTAARLAPAAIGVATAVGTDWQVTVTGAARDITSAVLAENQFNSPPPVGFRYVGVDMTISYNGAASASPAQVSISAVGANNLQQDGYCGVVPNEFDLYTDLFAGGSAIGTMCFVVPDDGAAIALFATSDYNSFIWFATN